MKRFIILASTVITFGSLAVACGSSGSGSGAISEKAYCQLIKDYKADSSKFDAVFSSSTTPDPAKVKEAFGSMQGMLKNLADKAPAAIKADVTTVVTATDKLIGLLSKNDYDFTKLSASADAQELQTVMSDTKVSEASGRLDKYGQDTCGIAPDTTTATS
jgi:hypothetical protein